MPTAGLALSAPVPSPAAGPVRFTLELATSQSVRVEVFDALGRRVAVPHDGPLVAGTHAISLDTSSFPAGVYIVRATSEGFTATRRMVVR
jgi:hypothetical protein